MKKSKAIVKPYTHERWKRVNWAAVKEIYLLRQDEISLEDLAREFNIAPPYLRLIAARDNWSMQRKLWQNKTLLKTAEKLTDKRAEVRARNIAIAEGALSYLANRIRNQKIKCSMTDVDKIARLVEFLYGNADSRPDNASSIEQLIRAMGQSRGKEHKATIAEDKLLVSGEEE